jgi:NAD(P)-dependent dehydrogenase (short-subunit alcohol dehydrogenase family)
MRLDTVHGLRTVVNTSSLGTTASICPGWVDTPMNRKLAEELGGMNKLGPIIKRQQPLPRMITTREVGNAVCFLASDDASATIGAVLCVYGAASAAI